MNFIDKFVSVVSRMTDSPMLYVRAAAYFCTSVLFGLHITCPDSRVERVNEWFLLSGAPGITRKSTILGISTKLCRSMIAEYLKYKFSISDRDAYKTADMMFFESGTTEGISDHLSVTCEMPEIDRYAFISAEYGSVLKSVIAKGYLADLTTFLSKLYYGESTKVLLSHKGKKSENEKVRYVPEGLYVCALIGIQDLHLYLDRMFVKQGFIRRFVIIHADPRNKDRRFPPVDPTVKVVKILFDKLVPNFFDMFLNYNESGTILTVLDSDARDAINAFWDNCERYYFNNPEDSYTVYIQSMWEHLYKLSVLEAISRTPDPPSDAAGNRIVTIEKEDVMRAINFIEGALRSVETQFAMIDAQPKYTELNVRAGELGLIKRLVYSSGQNGISKSDLLKNSGLTVRQLDELVITLLETGEIACYRCNAKQRGRKALMFFNPSYTPQGQEWEEISPAVYKLLR